MLAETAATASGLDIFFYQLHRDTRLQELVGPEVAGIDGQDKTCYKIFGTR